MPRIRYRPDQVSIPCRAFNHSYDEQATTIFVEQSAYFGTVWVQYDRCRRDCGRVRLKIMSPGAQKLLTAPRYRSENPDYDTSMSKAEAQRQHALIAREATREELTAVERAASTDSRTSTSV